MEDGNRCECCSLWIPYPDNMDMIEVRAWWGSGFICEPCFIHGENDENWDEVVT